MELLCAADTIEDTAELEDELENSSELDNEVEVVALSWGESCPTTSPDRLAKIIERRRPVMIRYSLVR